MPYELAQHFDPRVPLLVGGLGQGEDKLGFMRLRFKRHRWFPKILKNRDPLVRGAWWCCWLDVPIKKSNDVILN